MTYLRRRGLAGAALLIAIIFAISPLRAWAHGGGVPRITGERAGSYLVYVWAAPGDPRAGDTLHLTIGLTLAGPDGMETPVTDAAVSVKVQGPGAGEATTFAAKPGASAGGVFYEVDTPVGAAGEWTAVVQVDGEKGSGEFQVPVTVAPGAGPASWMIGVAIAAVVAAVGVWVLRGRGRGKARTTTVSA